MAESTGDSPLDYAVLAAGVAAAVKSTRAPEPEQSVVTKSLRMRADGATYEAIAEGVGVSAKRAASWCRQAARIDDRFDARSDAPRKVRKEAAAKAPLEKLIGWRPRPGTRAVLERRAKIEGRSLTDLVQTAVDAYLQRKSAGVEILVRRQLRKELKAELRAVADAVSSQSVEIARQGNNLNQLTRFCQKYQELPLAITSELESVRLELAANRVELARLTDAVEKLVGGADR
ncbi:hypothetical protein L5G28_08540 [Gordonia sp. HY285]|uniref:hypothetical protein n=1 Tax=Gordonia liuliyuniae TaxID=2911517 RepID=UPI001F29384E|nr:hypothetical protein [Gordonia liuliyuniae]MCF8610205.1 hypothetical protein [Gordonia liuliyuniae]